MEKNSCEIIKDLLPLYCDEVCSKESVEFIEEHLKDCPDCRVLLEKMRIQCSLSDEQELHHEQLVKNMASGWRKSVRKGFLKGMWITLLICLLLPGTYWGLTRWAVMPVPCEDIRADVGNVTVNHVQVVLEVTDGKKVFTNTMDMKEDGKLYLLEKRGVLKTQNGSGANWTGTLTFPRIYKTEDGESIEIKEIYYGTEKDNILIWQE